ncbi:hypothetical protein [Serratia sp. Se-RSBMAAmG]|nr:hypothetical protein [Serratia sp. Se-RSBMAAmG]MDI6977709.1 hypothetical protein [Serratia sp. Se-RSBMAAmG]
MSELSKEELQRLEEVVANLNISDVIKNSLTIEEWKALSKEYRRNYSNNK